MHEHIGAAKRKHRVMEFTVMWTPGHEGIPKNKQANAEAKKAVQGESSVESQLPEGLRGEIPASRSALKLNHLRHVRANMKDLFRASPRCQRTR